MGSILGSPYFRKLPYWLRKDGGIKELLLGFGTCGLQGRRGPASAKSALNPLPKRVCVVQKYAIEYPHSSTSELGKAQVLPKGNRV